MYKQAKYLIAGDRAIIVELGNEISREINRRVMNLAHGIEKTGLRGVSEVVPTYRSLLINYDPLAISMEELVEEIRKIEGQLDELDMPKPRVVEIPTAYGGDFGPDIGFVARYNGLTVDEVIDIHSKGEYLIYMLGFTPGFPYLGGMSERIAAPRLKNPRVKIPAGSVGIAETQTGIYSIESPGGWQLIGRTPVRLFDPHKKPYILLNAGDYIRFRPITETEYYQIEKQVKEGTYKVKDFEKSNSFDL